MAVVVGRTGVVVLVVVVDDDAVAVVAVPVVIVVDSAIHLSRKVSNVHSLKDSHCVWLKSYAEQSNAVVVVVLVVVPVLLVVVVVVVVIAVDVDPSIHVLSVELYVHPAKMQSSSLNS